MPNTVSASGEALPLAALRFLQAVRDDDTTAALALLTAHTDITGLSIRTAAAAGDLAAVHRHLAANPACAGQTIPPDHTPPLVYAVLTDIKQARGVSSDEHVALVRALLDAGADANTSVALPDTAGRIPVLYFPSVAGNVPVARLLLERGAAPTDGESVYHAAQHDRRDVLALLQAFGADLSRGPAGTGSSPLYFLASQRASNPVSASAVRGMEWLLEHGADPTVPLTAIGDGQLPSQLGETPLHRAVVSGHGAAVLSMLVQHGAAVDATRSDGATPFVLALRSGNVDAQRWLAEAGADTTRPTATDRLLGACLTADDLAARDLVAAQPQLMAHLGDDAARAIFVAMLDERHEALQLMLSLGWPLGCESAWGGTPLHWAAWNGQAALVGQLLDAGAPVNRRDSRYGSSPIAWAAHGSRFSAREKGAEADRDYRALVTQLLDAGATREEAINRWGEPPEAMGSEAVVAVLRERRWAG